MAVKYTDLTLEKYLHDLASDKPVPGGGSVSAYTASLAMGLIQMVGRITLKRKKKAGLSDTEEAEEVTRRATIEKIIESVERTKRDALQIVNLDPEVYQEVMRVWSQPEKRKDALTNSFRLQADLVLLAVMAREWNSNLKKLVKGSIKNDLLVSEALLEAAFRGAYHTAMINVQLMEDPGQKNLAQKALEQLKARFEKGCESDRKASPAA